MHYLTDTTTVKKFMKMLEEAGCECRLDMEAGTALAIDDGHVIYKALQKGRNGPWIAQTMDTDRIKFVKHDPVI